MRRSRGSEFQLHPGVNAVIPEVFPDILTSFVGAKRVDAPSHRHYHRVHEEFKGVKCVALGLHQVKRGPAAEDVGDFAYVLKTP